LVLAAFIEGLKSPTETAALEDLQRWTAKAELEIAADDNTSALETLARTDDQLIARGFHEEFLRVAKVLLQRTNWSSVETQDSPHFHSIVKNLINTLAEHDRETEARLYLKKYEEAVGTQTVARIRYLNTACYVEWILQNYAKAIAIGKEGVAIKAQSGIDTEEDVSHSLALALRDDGKLDEALKIFTGGQQLGDILTEDPLESGKSGPFYGNIGRCLQLKHQLDDALRCYVKSAALLYKSSSAETILNRGYAAFWIGETLEKKTDFKSAYAFLRSAIYIWAKRSPLLVGRPMKTLALIRDKVDEQWASMSNSAVDKYCRDWISNWRPSQKHK
jgi:tetratricopeptide (TPR) repeat protein